MALSLEEDWADLKLLGYSRDGGSCLSLASTGRHFFPPDLDLLSFKCNNSIRSTSPCCLCPHQGSQDLRLPGTRHAEKKEQNMVLEVLRYLKFINMVNNLV